MDEIKLMDIINKNKYFILVIIIIFIVLIIGYTYFIYSKAKPGTKITLFSVIEFTKDDNILKDRTAKPSEKKESNIKSNPVTRKEFSELNLRKNFGQIFWVGFYGKGNELGDLNVVEKLIDNFNVGGMIFYYRNILNKNDFVEPPKQISAVALKQLINFINYIKIINKENNNYPLFLAIDFEGGKVSPLTKAQITTPLPSPMAIASTRDIENLYKASLIIGRELSALGFNINFAPILDVSASDTNNIIQERSFGESPEMVSKLAGCFIKAQSNYNIYCVPKHFPGHGMTDAGFETPGLPNANIHPEAFKTSLLSFREIISNYNPKFLMTSHMNLNLFRESNLNVAFNKKMIELLRTSSEITISNNLKVKGLNFNGIIIADNLLAPCINFRPNEKDVSDKEYLERLKLNILKAFDAGHDILMLSHIFPDGKKNNTYKIRNNEKWRWAITISEFREIYDFIFQKIFEEPDSMLRIRRLNQLKKTIKKILRLKRELQNYNKSLSEDYFYSVRINNKHQDMANQLFVDSFVLLKSSEHFSSLSQLNENDRLLVFMPSNFRTYESIEKIKADANYHERLMRNVLAFDFTRELYNNFHKKCKLIFELEKRNPFYNEFNNRADRILNLIKYHKADRVIFLINKRSRWYLLHYVLEKLPKADFDFWRIWAILTDDATMLRSNKYFSNEIYHKLKKINIVVAFSGYGHRAKLLFKNLEQGSLDFSQAQLPFKVDELFPLPDYTLKHSCP